VTEHAVFYAFAHVGAESRIKKATFTEGKTHLSLLLVETLTRGFIDFFIYQRYINLRTVNNSFKNLIKIKYLGTIATIQMTFTS